MGSTLKELHANLQRHSPLQRLGHLELERNLLTRRLGSAMQALLTQKRSALELACRSLDAISPLATLQRGYAIVSRLPERQILRRAGETRAGDRIEARLAEGALVCTVEATEPSR